MLTDSSALRHKIIHPDHKVSKPYWAQVEGVPGEADLQPLNLWPRVPPIRSRKHLPDSWLELSIREGRNRQVRRMCAAMGVPVLRLVRYRIGSWTLDGLGPGQVLEL